MQTTSKYFKKGIDAALAHVFDRKDVETRSKMLTNGERITVRACDVYAPDWKAYPLTLRWDTRRDGTVKIESVLHPEIQIYANEHCDLKLYAQCFVNPKILFDWLLPFNVLQVTSLKFFANNGIPTYVLGFMQALGALCPNIQQFHISSVLPHVPFPEDAFRQALCSFPNLMTLDLRMMKMPTSLNLAWDKLDAIQILKVDLNMFNAIVTTHARHVWKALEKVDIFYTIPERNAPPPPSPPVPSLSVWLKLHPRIQSLVWDDQIGIHGVDECFSETVSAFESGGNIHHLTLYTSSATLKSARSLCKVHPKKMKSLILVGIAEPVDELLSNVYCYELIGMIADEIPSLEVLSFSFHAIKPQRYKKLILSLLPKILLHPKRKTDSSLWQVRVGFYEPIDESWPRKRIIYNKQDSSFVEIIRCTLHDMDGFTVQRCKL
jgi:hypothetical protein